MDGLVGSGEVALQLGALPEDLGMVPVTNMADAADLIAILASAGAACTWCTHTHRPTHI